MEESKGCYIDVYVRRRRKKRKISREGEYLFFWRRRNTEEKEENIWRRSLQKVSKILRSLGFSLGLETFANFWRVSVLVSENLVSGKKSRFWFRKIWSQKKIMGFGYREFGLEKRISFGKFGIEKKSFALEKFGIGRKVSVLVSVKILVSSFSALQWLESLSSIFGLTIVCI